MHRQIDIEQLCADKGLRITEQRKIIAKVLSDSEDHPDVETLHSRAAAVDPNISIATVYRTVRLFEEDDILEKLHHHGGDLMHKGRVDVSDDMTRHDEERLVQLISNHMHYTGSTRARDILDNWADYRGKFRKVMPVEYRRALKEMKANADAEPKIAIGA